jgi:hypothetical protein
VCGQAADFRQMLLLGVMNKENLILQAENKLTNKYRKDINSI